MTERVGTRRGQAFIVVAIATIILLIGGLGVVSWFSSSQTADSTEVSASVRLASVELCVNNRCESGMAAFVIDDTYATAGFATLVVAVFFGAVLAWSLYTRIATGFIPRLQRVIGISLAGLGLAMTLFCMFVVPPDRVSSRSHRYSARFAYLEDDDVPVVTTPHLALGGFMLLVALGLGAAILHTGRPDPEADEPDDAPRRSEPRREIVAPPRGVETDPFRAPPAPPPVAVIKHERPATAPLELDPDDAPPKLLR